MQYADRGTGYLRSKFVTGPVAGFNVATKHHDRAPRLGEFEAGDTADAVRRAGDDNRMVQVRPTLTGAQRSRRCGIG
jgi:hypothetical protein